MHRRRWRYVVAVLLVAGCGDVRRDAGRFSAADSTAIRGTLDAYVAAWLANDEEAVMATLSADAMLLPPRAEPLQGDSAIRAFWWPKDGSRTTITGFTWRINEVVGSDALAYTRGESTLAWTWAKDTVRQSSSSRSPNLTVLRRQADGAWKISRQMWGPALP